MKTNDKNGTIAMKERTGTPRTGNIIQPWDMPWGNENNNECTRLEKAI